MPISSEKLTQVFGIPKDEAKRLSTAIRYTEALLKVSSTGVGVDDVMQVANRLIDGHGVEALNGAWQSKYWQDIVALYVNRGDTYDLTVVYKVPERKFELVSWGYLVESNWGRKHGVK